MSKIGNKYIIEIGNEAEIGGQKKYWVKGFANLCLDDNVINKLDVYKEIPNNEKDAKVGDIVQLGDFGTTDYLITHVETRCNSRPLLHLLNLNNGHVYTHGGKYRKTGQHDVRILDVLEV